MRRRRGSATLLGTAVGLLALLHTSGAQAHRSANPTVSLAFFNGTDADCQFAPVVTASVIGGACTASPVGVSNGLSFVVDVDEMSNVWHWRQYQFPGCKGFQTNRYVGHGTRCTNSSTHLFANGWHLVVSSPLVAPCLAQVWSAAGCSGRLVQEFGITPGECFPDHQWGRFASGRFNVTSDGGSGGEGERWQYAGYSDAGCSTPIEWDEGPVGACGGADQVTTITCAADFQLIQEQ